MLDFDKTKSSFTMYRNYTLVKAVLTIVFLNVLNAVTFNYLLNVDHIFQDCTFNAVAVQLIAVTHYADTVLLLRQFGLHCSQTIFLPKVLVPPLIIHVRSAEHKFQEIS